MMMDEMRLKNEEGTERAASQQRFVEEQKRIAEEDLAAQMNLNNNGSS